MTAEITLPDRALTLWQPWAWLVAAGHKNIENRPRGFSHKSFRGEFWIHAGAGSKDRMELVLGEQFKIAQAICIEILGRDVIPPLDSLTYGAIIGRATITGILEPRPRVQDLTIWDAGVFRQVPWHFPDQYGFKVERAQLLETPVPCRGYQGFWRVPESTMQELRQAA